MSETVQMKERLKQRLFSSIGAQLDQIAYVPEDLGPLARHSRLDGQAFGALSVRAGEAELAGQDQEDSLGRDINAHYDHVFYDGGLSGLLNGDSDFRNLGYWDGVISSQNLACERLMDHLMDFIADKRGRILDVACGMGASTRRLIEHYNYPAQDVWAINISDKQLASTRERAPGCHALRMSATALQFEDGFFDNLLCIEAAFHFETRQQFLQEALRVLKPGGRLVLSDILMTSAGRMEQYSMYPSAGNHLESPEQYRALLEQSGFRNIVIEDVSKQVWGGHFAYASKRVHEAFYDGQIDLVQLTDILWTYYHANAVMGTCLFVSAQK